MTTCMQEKGSAGSAGPLLRSDVSSTADSGNVPLEVGRWASEAPG